MEPSVCIVIPAYNEAQAIAATLREYRQAFPWARIVVIDNNSNDGTSAAATEAMDPALDILLFEPKQGKGKAVKRGLSRLPADVYIMTDGDQTYPAADARKLYNELIRTRADMLIGDRVSGGAYQAQNTRPGHNLGNRILTNVISDLAGQRYNDVLSGLRVMSWPFVATLDLRSAGFQLETELNIVAAYLRADVVELPIEYRERDAGSHSKLNTIGDGIRILGFALTNWIAFAPLQAFSLLAFACGLMSAGLAYRVIAGFMTSGWPYTTTAVAGAVVGLVGALAMFTGLTLRVLGRDNRRREIARFLEVKRNWNARLDAKSA